MDEQLAKLHAMRELLTQLTTGKITKEQYDVANQTLFGNPYSETHEESDVVGAGDGEPWNWDDRTDGERHLPVNASESGRAEARNPSYREQAGYEMESVSELSLPRCADGETTHTERQNGLSQKQKLLDLLGDGEWHTTPQIQKDVYGGDHLGVARISARILDLRSDGHLIESKKMDKTIWAYKLSTGVRDISKLMASG